MNCQEINENKFLWERCEIEEIELEDVRADEIKTYNVKALSFFFKNGKVSIHRNVAPWIASEVDTSSNVWQISGWSNNGMILFTRFIDRMLHKIPHKKLIELSSILNASGIAKKNAPKMIIQMGSMLFEKANEIEVVYPKIEARKAEIKKRRDKDQWMKDNPEKALEEYLEYYKKMVPDIDEKALKIMGDNFLCTIT